jgi:hypothetical protein
MLIDDAHHFVLLGDPGAGKTTTLKRIINRLLATPETPGDNWSVPILIVLREHSNNGSIAAVLVEKLGLRGLYLRSVVNDAEDTLSKHGRSLENDVSESQFVADILNSWNAVLFLDGLDEVSPEVREAVHDGIVRLARKLTSAKVIASCRSGDYRRPIEGLALAELLPLDRAQIEVISQKWLGGRSDRFMSEIAEGAPAELANRPLFLFQMLVLAQRMESVPDQPSSLCRQMVRLMLQDWDQERSIVRGSTYRSFGIDDKLQFLTALAYYGTFELKTTRFNRRDFVRGYDRLRRRFALPPNEADAVASEIESHTGIVVEVGYKEFEFSHLSIQEYLAAEHAVRLPTSKDHRRLLERSPATMAVAVALSSEPDLLFAELSDALPADDLLYVFIERVLQERPMFLGGEPLGSAALKMMERFGFQDNSSTLSLLIELTDYPEVGPSLRHFIDWTKTRRSRTFWTTDRIALDQAMCDRWHIPGTSILVVRELYDAIIDGGRRLSD